jgi:pilus assembly protein Flp/PilA
LILTLLLSISVKAYALCLAPSAARETRTLSIQNGLLGQNNGTGPCVIIIKKFLKDETAATAIEYGLIAAGIALAIITVVNGLGSKLGAKFTAINTSLK